MNFRFAGFELDDDQRALRLDGEEIEVQPRVFDLLAYLVSHRDRVVSKDELLDALWPGSVVADGALQRAVSLARAALRRGGLDGAIRTYARHGYRFCADAEGDRQVDPPAPEREALSSARAACAQGRWLEAVTLFEQADHAADLVAADLEQWALAAQSVARPADAVAPLERAVAAYGAVGDRRGAARAATMLAHVHLEGRETAVAKGWLRRAANMLDGIAECAEHGHVEWISCRVAIVEGRLDDGIRHGENALAIGRRLADPDIEAVALIYTGHGLIASGDIERGISLQDEAGAAVLGGGVAPLYGGLIFCGLIYSCVNRGDWLRAAQWTDQFTRWCGDSGFFNFPGMCRLHRAEVLSLRGELEAAEAEVEDAIEQLAVAAPYAEGDAYRVLGEIRLVRGELAGAEAAFRRAHELGWDPQPGYALLQVARGNADSAVRALERSLEDRGWANRQRRGMLLANLVIVAAAAGDTARAESALRDLEGEPALWSAPALAAMHERARAELAIARGRLSEGIAGLRRALRIWTDVSCPLNVASVRVRLAQVLVDDGDADAAELELSAAQSVFRRAGAVEQFRSCEQMRSTLGQDSERG